MCCVSDNCYHLVAEENIYISCNFFCSGKINKSEHLTLFPPGTAVSDWKFLCPSAKFFVMDFRGQTRIDVKISENLISSSTSEMKSYL